MANGDDENGGKRNPGWLAISIPITGVAVVVSLLGFAAGGLWWTADLNSRVGYLERSAINREDFRSLLKVEAPWYSERDSVFRSIGDNKESIGSVEGRMRQIELNQALIMLQLKRIEQKVTPNSSDATEGESDENASIEYPPTVVTGQGGRGCQ